MNKNGFVFVETIVVITVLTTALLLLFSSFNNILKKEKERMNYDDVAYIYRTHYLKNTLDKLNLNDVLTTFNSDDNKYFLTINKETTNLFIDRENYQNYFNKILDDYEVEEMFIVKTKELDNLKACLIDKSCDNEFDEEVIKYLKTINVDIACDNILVVSYATCHNSGCEHFYSWVSV